MSTQGFFGESAILKVKDETTVNVQHYIALTKQAAEIKAQIELLKGWFERRGIDDLKATKSKTVDYWNGGSKVEVSRSETVSPLSATMLKPLFGETFGDFVREKTSYDLSAPCKRLLAAIDLGNYIETPLGDIINQITEDEKTRAALRKKLRGDFKKDRAALISIAGLSEKDAEYYAYMTTESVAYERFLQILQAGGYTGTVTEARETIRAAVIVEEGVKVSSESGE